MRTPALAIGWAIWCQNRRVLAACAVALLVMAVAYPFLFSFTRSPAVVFTSTVPFDRYLRLRPEFPPGRRGAWQPDVE